MIILTTENIRRLSPIKIGSIISYIDTDYCLAEVGNDFNITHNDLKI
jgi:hypothetical protein